jgi:WD40 repeat protein
MVKGKKAYFYLEMYFQVMIIMYLRSHLHLVVIILYHVVVIKRLKYGKYQQRKSFYSNSKTIQRISFNRFCIKTLVGHREWVRMVRVYQDGTLIASSSADHVCYRLILSTK